MLTALANTITSSLSGECIPTILSKMRKYIQMTGSSMEATMSQMVIRILDTSESSAPCQIQQTWRVIAKMLNLDGARMKCTLASTTKRIGELLCSVLLTHSKDPKISTFNSWMRTKEFNSKSQM